MRKASKIFVLLGAVIFAGAMTAHALGIIDRASSQAAANEHPNCKVGEPSNLPSQSVLTAIGKILAKPIVIGCGHSNGELIQIVAYDTNKGFCFGVSRPLRGNLQGGECKPPHIQWRDFCVQLCIFNVSPADLGRRRSLRHAVVSGGASPSAHALVTTFGPLPEQARADTVEAKVSAPRLLRYLRQTEPFLVFGAILPRCVSSRDVQVTALVGGRRESVRGRNVLPHPCVAPPVPTISHAPAH